MPTQRNTKVLVHRQSSLDLKDCEMDWRDKLCQWQKVQQSDGSVVDLADLKRNGSLQSSVLSVLGVLQACFTSDHLQECVETSLVNGLKRSSGLNLINFAMNLSYSHQRFFDMVQWFNGSLRNNRMQV